MNSGIVEKRFNFTNKFVTFYALTHWAERFLQASPFESFRFGFYAIVWTLWVSLTAAVAVTLQDTRGERNQLLGVLLVSCAAAISIVLPLFHYHQGDGFYHLLSGVGPLIAVWAAYGVTESVSLRLILLIVWVATERFTYGINIGDALLTASVLGTFESRRWSGARRWILLAGSAVLLGAAVVFWMKLAAFVFPGGHIAHSRIAPMLAGEAVLVFILLLLPKTRGEGHHSPLGRLVTFAAVNGTLNVCGHILWLASSLPGGYYFQRYGLHTNVLLASASAVLGPLILFQDRMQRPNFKLVLGVSLLAALTCLAFAFPRQQDGFMERMFRRSPPWRHLRPLADLEGLKRIEKTLAAENKGCLVVLTPSWPMGSFMNGSLGVLDRWHSIPEEPLDRRGKCAFWYGQEQDLATMALYSRPNVVGAQTAYAMGIASEKLARELDSNARKTCEEYAADWDPTRKLRLCHLCFE